MFQKPMNNATNKERRVDLQPGQWIKFSANKKAQLLSNEYKMLSSEDRIFLVLKKQDTQFSCNYILVDKDGIVFDYSDNTSFPCLRSLGNNGTVEQVNNFRITAFSIDDVAKAYNHKLITSIYEAGGKFLDKMKPFHSFSFISIQKLDIDKAIEDFKEITKQSENIDLDNIQKRKP